MESFFAKVKFRPKTMDCSDDLYQVHTGIMGASLLHDARSGSGGRLALLLVALQSVQKLLELPHQKDTLTLEHTWGRGGRTAGVYIVVSLLQRFIGLSHTWFAPVGLQIHRSASVVIKRSLMIVFHYDCLLTFVVPQKLFLFIGDVHAISLRHKRVHSQVRSAKNETESHLVLTTAKQHNHPYLCILL